MVSTQKMRESPVEGEQAKQPGSPKSRLAMLKRSSQKKSTASASDPFRFQGNGVVFKGKLIGIRDVDGARGDAMCAEAMRQAKAAVKASGAHKQRITLNINLDGIKINDEKTQAVLHSFPVSRISFIARDTSDARAFGFVYGSADGKYKFYGIKTAQTADHAVLSIRDMFQIVFEMKKKQIEQVKQQQEDNEKKEREEHGIRSEDGVLVADLLDLETELHNIEQGVHQLEHIPMMADDFGWPGEAATQQPDAFGQMPFGAAFSQSPPTQAPPPPAAQPADPFGDPFNTTPPFSSLPAPVASQQQPNLFSQSPASLFGVTPSPVYQQAPPVLQWNTSPATATVAPAAPAFHHTHSTPNFSDTNPFAAAAMSQQPAVADPFDTSSVLAPAAACVQPVQWGNENNAPAITHAHSFTDNTTAPAPQQWETKKVTSLEDAFTKLVDMDSLMGRPAETKKNPFEHLINPPKASLNNLAGGVPSIPQRPPQQIVFPGSTSDPFSDAFFN